MAVVIDPSRGAISEAIGNLGAGLSALAFKTRRRERELLENPEQLQSFFPKAREAREKGPEAIRAFEEAIGVGEGFAEEHIFPAFQETPQQEATRLSRDIGLPELIADNALLQATFESGELQTGLDMSLPFYEAFGKLNELQAGIAENQAQRSYYTIFQEEGGPRIQATSDISRLENIAALAGAETEAVKFHAEAVNSIDQSTPQGRQLAMMGTLFMGKPTQFANYLAQQEDYNFRLRLAQLQARPDPIEQGRFNLTFLKDQAAAIDHLRELEDEKDADPDVLEAQRTLVDNYANINQQLQDSGILYPNTLVRGQPELGFFGGEKGNKFITQNVKSAQVRNIADAIAQGTVTLEEVEANKRELFVRDDVIAEWDALVSAAQEAGVDQAEQEDEGESRASVGETFTVTKAAREQQIENLRAKLRRTIVNTEMDPELKAEKIQRLQDLIKGFQDQLSIGEWLHGAFSQAGSQTGGSLAIPGRNDGNQ